ncbi:MAG: hypothetical protein O3B21_13020 [Proteobacteria bacterium]|nr:hypothetical protein [Pseudomonadota bacterium]
MHVIDGHLHTEGKSIWQKAAHDRTAASLHAESAAALRAGRLQLALSLIEAVLASETSLVSGAIDPQFRCHHAACLRVLGRFAEAEKAYWEILRENPETVDAIQGLRALYHAVGQCGATAAPPRRQSSPRYQSTRHSHRDAARLLKRRI